MSCPTPLMNKEELKCWILRRLGAPQRDVELYDENLNDAIDDAIRWFTAKKGLRKQKEVDILAGQNVYDVPEDSDLILDVAFNANPYDFSYLFTPYLFPDQQIPYNTFAAPLSQGVYSTFVQNIQYIEMAKRVLGAELDWRQEGRKLLIFPVPKNTGKMIWDYKSNCVTIEQLSERDHDLVKRYALAVAKMDVGNIRDKYGIYPGAQGNVPLDGKRQIAEAEAMFAKLDEEIALSGFPMGIVIG